MENTENCRLCGLPLPGEHRQEIDRTPGEQDLVFWICPVFNPTFEIIP